MNLADPTPATSETQQGQYKEGRTHGSNTESTPSELESSIDPEGSRYWRRACAALPPMTPEEIAAVAVILRRIDARRDQAR